MKVKVPTSRYRGVSFRDISFYLSTLKLSHRIRPHLQTLARIMDDPSETRNVSAPFGDLKSDARANTYKFMQYPRYTISIVMHKMQISCSAQQSGSRVVISIGILTRRSRRHVGVLAPFSAYAEFKKIRVKAVTRFSNGLRTSAYLGSKILLAAHSRARELASERVRSRSDRRSRYT